MNCVPYQVCPVCKGEGFTIKYVMDLSNSTVVNYCSQVSCIICNGKKIIPMYIVSDEIKDYYYNLNAVYISDGKGGFIPAQ